MIRNETLRTLIVQEHLLVDTYWSRGLGLMFRKKLDDEGLIMVYDKLDKGDLTNLFVFQIIDILWLDEYKRVIQIRRVPPFYPIILGPGKTKYVIELPPDKLRYTELGDKITWKE